MDRYIHNENIALFKKKLADPRTTATERETIERLLADEQARQLPPGPKPQDGQR